jgi:hypothetical protein
MAYLMSLG